MSVLVVSCAQNAPSKDIGRYLIGFHPNATHFVEQRTDISNILQGALNTLVREGGGKITIASGTYFISRNIIISSDTHIDGFGIRRTTLQLADFAPTFQSAGMLRSFQSNNIIISNMTINGNKHHQVVDQEKYFTDSTKNDTWYGRFGVFIEGCTDVLYDNIQVTNFQLHGIAIDGNDVFWGNRIVIRNSFATYNDFEGIVIDQTMNVVIDNTTTKANGRNGYNIISGARNVTIMKSFSFKDGLTFPNGTGCGIQIRTNKVTTQNITVVNSTIVESKNAAICLNNVRNISVYNNSLFGKSCVNFERTNDTSVVSNLCVNPVSLRRIWASTTNKRIVISDNTLKVGTFSKTSDGLLEIVIGYSENATHIIENGADAYQEIQQSLDDIKINRGGTLRFEEGTYILSSYIEVASNTVFIGAGINKTILKLMDFADPWWIPNTGFKRSGFVRSAKTNNLVFANLTIDGNKQKQRTDKHSVYGRFGFFTEGSNNVSVDSFGVINFQGYGFDPHGIKDSMTWSQGLTISNSYAAFNDWDGYTIDQSTDVVLVNNTAHDNGRHGFNIVTGTYNLVMYGNVAFNNGFYYYEGNPGCGVAIQNNLYYNTRNITAYGNVFDNNDDAGVCVTDVTNITIVNNTITNVNYTDFAINLCIKIINTTETNVLNNLCNGILFDPFYKPPRRVLPPSSTNARSPPKKRVKNSANQRYQSPTYSVILAVVVMLILW